MAQMVVYFQSSSKQDGGLVLVAETLQEQRGSRGVMWRVYDDRIGAAKKIMWTNCTVYGLGRIGRTFTTNMYAQKGLEEGYSLSKRGLQWVSWQLGGGYCRSMILEFLYSDSIIKVHPGRPRYDVGSSSTP